MIGIIQETSLFGTKTNFRCNQSSFVGHIIQTIYVFAYEKINQNKAVSGLTQYSKRKIFVFGSEIAGLLDHSYHNSALANKIFEELYSDSDAIF